MVAATQLVYRQPGFADRREVTVRGRSRQGPPAPDSLRYAWLANVIPAVAPPDDSSDASRVVGR
jgi:hypothetical protein